MLALYLLIALTALLRVSPVQEQPSAFVATIDRDLLPVGAHATLEDLNTRNADLRDVLRAIARQHDLNLWVDDQIEASVTVRLAGLPVLDALLFLCEQHGLALEQAGGILRVRLPEIMPPPLQVRVVQGRLFLDLQNVPIDVAARALAEAGGAPIVVRQGVAGGLTGYLQDIPFEAGLRALLESNGFTLRQGDGIWLVDRRGVMGEEPGGDSGTAWIGAGEDGIELDLRDAGIAQALQALADQAGFDLVIYDLPEGRITVRASGLTVEQALNYLLRNTSLTYRREGGVIIVGDRQLTGIASTRLLLLRHIHPEGIAERMPDAIRRAAAFQTVEEQNALLVTAPQDVIAEVEAILAQIDAPTPQILIEALVVDFESSDLSQLGVTFGRDGAGDAGNVPAGETYSFGAGADQAGGIDLAGGAREAERYVNALAGLLGIGSITRLPDDFYFRIQALEREGKAHVRSRPRIATLNGHTAHISVGTTQYYILKTLLPFSSSGQVNEAEHFERVEANVSLEITPWVGASGEVTAEIHPTFATPVGVLDPRVPPTINNRTVQTTVRLRAGETVAIGGLIQESESEAFNKVPILGDIPLVGRLFRNRRKDMHRSELVIFITPHVFTGDVHDIEIQP